MTFQLEETVTVWDFNNKILKEIMTKISQEILRDKLFSSGNLSAFPAEDVSPSSP